MRGFLKLGIAGFVFALSGGAALVYQVAWQRLLAGLAGGDVGSLTLIVTAFMAGLGTGALAGGWLADRTSQGCCLVLFAMLEAAVALLGWGSAHGLGIILPEMLFGRDAGRVLTGAVVIAVLLPPTLLMGMSLPLLVRALVREVSAAPRVVGLLYGLNTLGAAAGALAGTWVLLPLAGLEGAVRLAAGINVSCALAVVPLLGVVCKASREALAAPSAGAVRATETGLVFRNWALVYALTGFLALSLEIVWLRLLSVMVKATAFTTGTLLALYLGALGTGVLVGVRLAAHSRRPGRGFLYLQGAGVVSAGVLTAGTLWALNTWPSLSLARQYLDSYEPLNVESALGLLGAWWSGTAGPGEAALAWVWPLLQGGVPLVMMGPPLCLMGAAFPLLQKAVQDDAALLGRRVGALQAANIAGCIAGALLTGTVLLPVAGTGGMLRLLTGVGGAFLVAGLLWGPLCGERVWWARLGAGTAVLMTLLAVLPGNARLWAQAHGTAQERMLLAEDATGVSVLKPESTGNEAGRMIVFVNGIGQSWLPYGGIHSLLGALPVLLHPHPEEIAMIGLGSGDTLYCAAAREETRELVCIEILGAQLQTLEAYSARAAYAALRGCLEDARIHHIHGDGRRYLAAGQRRYDVIEADAARPTSAHSGLLYSKEYFQLLRSRLKPGGLAVTWCPTTRVRQTFMNVFPHVMEVGPVLLGSSEAITPDLDALRLRLADPHIRAHYRLAGVDIVELMKPVLAGELRPVNMDVPPAAEAVNTDLFPRDEFTLPVLRGRRSY